MTAQSKETMKKIKHPMIGLKDISISFGDKQVLSRINLDLFKNESVAIIGTSGCGKSVTMKILLSLLQPTSGKVILNRNFFNSQKDFYNSIGTVFQNSALFDSMTVFENICFAPLHNKKISREQAYSKAIKLTNSVGLAKKTLDFMPSSLSGGMKKRVALARALANDPSIIFVDEPTTGLDPVMKELIAELTEETIRKNNLTALTITHDISLALKIASRICMLHEGKIVWQGSKKQILTTSNKYIKQFMTGSLKGPINPMFIEGN